MVNTVYKLLHHLPALMHIADRTFSNPCKFSAFYDSHSDEKFKTGVWSVLFI